MNVFLLSTPLCPQTEYLWNCEQNNTLRTSQQTNGHFSTTDWENNEMTEKQVLVAALVVMILLPGVTQYIQTQLGVSLWFIYVLYIIVVR